MVARLKIQKEETCDIQVVGKRHVDIVEEGLPPAWHRAPASAKSCTGCNRGYNLLKAWGGVAAGTAAHSCVLCADSYGLSSTPPSGRIAEAPEPSSSPVSS